MMGCRCDDGHKLSLARGPGRAGARAPLRGWWECSRASPRGRASAPARRRRTAAARRGGGPRRPGAPPAGRPPPPPPPELHRPRPLFRRPPDLPPSARPGSRRSKIRSRARGSPELAPRRGDPRDGIRAMPRSDPRAGAVPGTVGRAAPRGRPQRRPRARGCGGGAPARGRSPRGRNGARSLLARAAPRGDCAVLILRDAAGSLVCPPPRARGAGTWGPLGATLGLAAAAAAPPARSRSRLRSVPRGSSLRAIDPRPI